MPTLTSESTLLLFGGGGHAKVVADAVMSNAASLNMVVSDRDPEKCRGELLEGVQFIEIQHALTLDAEVHICIGENISRERETTAWGGKRLRTIVHRDATVSAASVQGAGCFVAARSVLAPASCIGDGVIVNHGAVVDHDVRVGDFSHIAPGVIVGGNAHIGRRVLLGAGAILLPGVSIGDDVVVGAGCVVNRSLLTPGTYIGLPARRLK